MVKSYIDSPKNFVSWFREAKPGDVAVYYGGHLSAVLDVPNFKELKDLVWSYAIEGKVYLTQRKVSDGDYDYLAMKSLKKVQYLIPNDYYTNSYYMMRVRQKSRETAGAKNG